MIPSILVIKKDPIPFVKELGGIIQNLAHIHSAATGMDGLLRFQLMDPAPMAVIIDDELPDLFGSSLGSIIKDTEAGKDSLVYVINITTLLQNAKADYFMQKPCNTEMLFLQVKQDIEKKLLLHSQSEEIQKAISIQRGMLPPRLRSTKFDVTSLFSPFNELSGDGIFYWYPERSKAKDRLYGFLFDCTGHDISSYGQCSSLWISFRREFQNFQRGIFSSLSEVMDSINEMLTEFSFASDEPNMPAAISFFFDFADGTLHYCSAGNPEILYREKDKQEYESIKMRSTPFGYLAEAHYEEQSMKLDGIQEVIFASDGFSELLLKNQFPEFPPDTAKHDDVSMISVRLKI